MERHREKFAESALVEFNRTVYDLNRSSAEEIRTLTRRLTAFLEDVKENLKHFTHFDETIQRGKTEWDANIDDWSCSVREQVRKLSEQIVKALRTYETTLLNSRKFTPAQIESFLNEQVTKLNQLIIINEKQFSDTERHLKLIFDTLLQHWLVSYSYRELEPEECGENIEAHEEVEENAVSLNEALNILDEVVGRLREENTAFIQISYVKNYLSHILMCEEHAKLHLKEALFYLRKHLEERQDYYMIEEETKSQLEELWMEIVTLLRDQNQDFKNYTNQAAYAWNQFVKRIHCAEETAANAVYKLRKCRQAKTLRAEIKMNSLLDHLRESSSVTNMENIYERVLSELEHTELEYVACRNAEDEILKQLVTATFGAFDIFTLQLQILNDSSINTDIDIFCIELDLDDPDVKDITNPELVRMKFCVYSAQTWIHGIKETLGMLESELPNFLKMFLENATCVYKGESEYWLMLQLDKLNKRKQRIRSNILEIRAAELQAHEKAQKNLQQIVDKEVRRINAKLKRIKEELTNSDTGLVKHLDETKTDKLEDTPEKKIKLLKDEALVNKHEEMRSQVVRKSKYETERLFKWLEDACCNYLHCLRLFHEGGNYNTEECDTALKKFSKITKGLAKNIEKTSKKLDSILSGTREAFKKKLAKIVYPEPTEDALLRAAEREANERLEICFNRLKEMIKNETYRGMNLLNEVKDGFEAAKEANSFEKWHEMINEIESIHSYFQLSRTFPMLELSVVIGVAQVLGRTAETPDEKSFMEVSSFGGRRRRSKRTRSTLLSISSKKMGKRKKSRMSSATSKDSLFHAKIKFDEDNYLTNTKFLIDEMTPRVRVILDDAYTKYKKTKEDYAPLCARALSTLRHYNLQCESVWTLLFYEFMDIFRSILSTIIEYIEFRKIRHIYDSTNEALRLKTEHKTNLAKLNVQGVKERIDYKLKPWHGYPLNKPLLQELLKDVAEHCKEQLLSRKTVNETYKEQLKALVSDNKTKAIDVAEDAKFLFQELFNNSVLNKFLQEILDYVSIKEFGQTFPDELCLKHALSEYCSNLPTFKTASKRSTTKSESEVQVRSMSRTVMPPTVDEFYDDIDFSFLKKYTFSGFPQRMNDTTKILRRIKSEMNLPQDMSTITVANKEWPESELAETTGEGLFDEDERISPLWTKFREEIQQYIQAYESTAIKSLHQAKKDFDSVAGDLTRWKNEWISNIKEVNRLYLINPILDHPPNKLSSDPAAHLRVKKLEELPTD